MKKIFLMLVATGLFSFVATSCGSGDQSKGDTEMVEDDGDQDEDEDMPAREEGTDEVEDGNDKNDPR